MVLPHTKMDRLRKPGLKKSDIFLPERAGPSFGRPQGRWKPIGESRMSFRVGGECRYATKRLAHV